MYLSDFEFVSQSVLYALAHNRVAVMRQLYAHNGMR